MNTHLSSGPLWILSRSRNTGIFNDIVVLVCVATLIKDVPDATVVLLLVIILNQMNLVSFCSSIRKSEFFWSRVKPFSVYKQDKRSL